MSMAEYTSSCECDSFYGPKMHFLKRKPKLMYPPPPRFIASLNDLTIHCG